MNNSFFSRSQRFLKNIQNGGMKWKLGAALVLLFSGSLLYQNCSPVNDSGPIQMFYNTGSGQGAIQANLSSSSSVLPAGGPLAGGNTISILGSGFNATTAITVDSQVCSNPVVTPDGINCVVPASANTSSYWASVTITTSGTSTTLPAAYAYGAMAIGQSGLTSRTTNLLNSVTRPAGMVVANNTLFVADANSSRVVAYPIEGSLSNNPTAAFVIGQADLQGGMYAGLRPNAGALQIGAPSGICTDGTRLFIADSNRNRVLVYNQIPSDYNAAADIVLGQVDFTGGFANQNMTAPTQSTLSNPQGIYCDSQQLIVADTGNNRVLIWNSAALSNNMAASVVLGQSAFTSGSANGGAGSVPSSSSLWLPTSVAFDGANLYVADTTNNRVLIWNSVAPLQMTNAQAATAVLGQTAFTTNTRNSGLAACLANSIASPKGLSLSNSRLYVTDASVAGNRILGWPVANLVSGTAGANATIVLGQSNATSCPVNGGLSTLTASVFQGPSFLYSSNGKDLFVADNMNNRVLHYNNAPKGMGLVSANQVVGQEQSYLSGEGWTTAAINPNFKAVQMGLIANNALFAVDAQQSRVLFWPTLPTSGLQPAAGVLGQPDLMTTVTNVTSGSVLATSLNTPRGIFVDSTNDIYLMDSGNNRSLIFPSSANIFQSLADTSAMSSLGSPLSSGSVTYVSGGTMSESTPYAMANCGQQYFIADSGDNRVLVYSSAPASGVAPAFVVGQPFLNTTLPNAFLSGTKVASGTVGPTTLWAPQGVACDNVNNELLVADSKNNRVLAYPLPITQNAAPAIFALGQPDLMSGAINNDGAGNSGLIPNSASLYSPASALALNGKIYVSDKENSRIMVWSDPPTTGSPAAYVFGQTSFSGYYRNGGLNIANSNLLALPDALTASPDGSQLIIADQGNNRLLIIPAP